MLQFTGSQRARHNLVTKNNKKIHEKMAFKKKILGYNSTLTY